MPRARTTRLPQLRAARHAVQPRRALLAVAVWIVAGCPVDGSQNPFSPRDIVGIRLAVGPGHALLAQAPKSLVGWGGSQYGALGVPPSDEPMLPPATLVDVGDPVISVAAGTNHTCAVFDDGGVKCWGLNEFGQLGLGDTENRGDDPGEMGEALPTVDLGTDERAVAVSLGNSFSCALLESNAVKCWGFNEDGELGQGDVEARGDELGEMGDALPAIDLGTTRRILELDVGFEHACVLLEDGKVKCWGNSSTQTYTLGSSGASNIGDAPGQMGAALPEVNLGSDAFVETFSAGAYHTCVVLDDGHVKCWGQGSYTEPCPPDTCTYPRPRYNGGRLGYGDLEHRGPDPSMGDALAFVDVGAGVRVIAIEAGALHTCALLDTGNLKCWGVGNWNTLGNGGSGDIGDEPGEMGEALPLVDLGAGRIVSAYASSLRANCALLDDDGVKCWGSTAYPNEQGDSLPYIDLPGLEE